MRASVERRKNIEARLGKHELFYIVMVGAGLGLPFVMYSLIY